MAKQRTIWQLTSAVLGNSYLKGFFSGDIFKGRSKLICFPGLNCYSCPGAIGSCPIGSLQAVLLDLRYRFSFYLIGFLTLLGTTLGRWVCGWVCPFGFIQELLYKLPIKKKRLRINFFTRFFKYGILAIFVILLPLFWVDQFGFGQPTFCKFICPAGTLEGGVPLLLANESLRSAAGLLFQWKLLILVATIVASILIFRPFCRLLCPLGAILSIFNPVSLYHYQLASNCTNCGACKRSCKLEIDPTVTPNSPECIRCGECISSCPQGALKPRFGFKAENTASGKASTKV